MIWWRRLFITAFLIVMTITGLYWHRSTLLGWYLKGYAEKCYHCIVDYKEIKFAEDGGLLFSDVIIKPSKEALRGVVISCDEMHFDYLFSWSQRSLAGKIHVVHPTIALHQPLETSHSPSTRWDGKLKSKHRAFFFIYPQISLEIEEGELILANNHEVARWEGKVILGSQIESSFSFTTNEGKAFLSLQEKKKSIHGLLKMEKFPLFAIMELIKGKVQGMHDWKASQGEIDGELHLILGHHPPLFESGEMKVTNCVISSPMGHFDTQEFFIAAQGEGASYKKILVREGNWHRNGWGLSHIQGEWEVENKSILPSSYCHGKLGDMDLSLAFTGDLEDFQLLLNVEGNVGQLPEPLFIRRFLSEQWNQEPLKIELQLNPKGSWQGSLMLGKDRLVAEGEIKGLWNPASGPSIKLTSCTFSTSPLDIAKYAPCFKSPLGVAVWGGVASLRGKYADKKIEFDPLIENFSVRWSDLEAFLPHVDKGKISYHLINQTLEGNLPLNDLNLIDHHHHFSFYDGKGSLRLSNDEVTLKDLEFYSAGIFTVSDIALHLKDGVELLLNNHTFQGTLSQLKKAARHYTSSLFFLSLPLEANLSYLGEGLMARWRYHPEKEEQQWELVDASFEGDLTGGISKTHYGRMTLSDLNLRVDYNYQANQLILQDIRGSLLIGSGDNLEEYDLAGDKIHFTDFKKHQCLFDCWVGMRNRDILRVVGKTSSEELDGSSTRIGVDFDCDLTHLGVVYPSKARLILADWNRLEDLDLRFSFQLTAALGDFQRFIRSDFLGMSSGVTKAIDQIRRAYGYVDVQLRWQNESQFQYSLLGHDIALGDVEFGVIRLQGSKIDHFWNIDELQLDQLSMSAKLFNEDKNLRIPHFEMKVGTAGIMKSDAIYYSDDDHLDAHIHHFQLELAHLDQFNPLHAFIKRYQPAGKLEGTGNLRIDFLKNKWYRAEALLNARLQDLKIQDIPFSDVDEVAIGYMSDKGFTFQALETSMQRKQESREAVTLHLDRGGYDFLAEELWLRGLKFNVPQHHLEWIGENLHRALPQAFPAYFSRLLAECKRTESLKGVFDLQQRERYCKATLNLDEGEYCLGGTSHYLRHVTFTFNPNEIRLNILYDLYGRPFLLSFQSPNFDFPYGTFSVSSQFQQEPPLVLYWNRDSSGGISIEQAEGKVFGAVVDLKGMPSHLLDDSWVFEGLIAIDPSETAIYFPGNIWAEAAKKWRLGSGYKLQGEWKFFKKQPQNFSFKGSLSGRDVHVMGYQIDRLESDIQIDKGKIVIQQAHLTDSAGTMKLTEFSAYLSTQDEWTMDLRKVVFEAFKPKLLRHIGAPVKKDRETFTLQHLEITSLKGKIGDPSSWTAVGELAFHHPQSKEGKMRSFLSIPSETLKKVGIDLASLAPVSGEISFEIDQEKFYITRLKDVYSQNKLVKFQQPKNLNSTIDFHGKMDLFLSLKPYHVMFKFAEFFKVRIQGDVSNPTFNIKR